MISLLFIAFVVLKLLHRLSWSWWWVTAPLWGSFVLAAAAPAAVAFLR